MYEIVAYNALGGKGERGFYNFVGPLRPDGSYSMTDYLCLTVLGEEGEEEAGFKARLAEFWTHMLRNKRDDYEKVYAEATEFEAHGDRVSRQYLVEASAIPPILKELADRHIASLPVDLEETYSRYEASGPDWFQIEH